MFIFKKKVPRETELENQGINFLVLEHEHLTERF